MSPSQVLPGFPIAFCLCWKKRDTSPGTWEEVWRHCGQSLYFAQSSKQLYAALGLGVAVPFLNQVTTPTKATSGAETRERLAWSRVNGGRSGGTSPAGRTLPDQQGGWKPLWRSYRNYISSGELIVSPKILRSQLRDFCKLGSLTSRRIFSTLRCGISALKR